MKGDEQVGADHDVELLGLGDKLHRRVVDDHLLELDSRRLVLLGDLLANSEEETVSELHDVGLVNTGNLLLERQTESRFHSTSVSMQTGFPSNVLRPARETEWWGRDNGPSCCS